MNKRIIAALIAASGLVAFNASANDAPLILLVTLLMAHVLSMYKILVLLPVRLLSALYQNQHFLASVRLPVTVLVWQQS
ncbi:hypothetical protein QIG27_27050, partial [Klebsiella pneumoniae]|nr:hypothetical protein [Klebsiella pneumoniae]